MSNPILRTEEAHVTPPGLGDDQSDQPLVTMTPVEDVEPVIPEGTLEDYEYKNVKLKVDKKVALGDKHKLAERIAPGFKEDSEVQVLAIFENGDVIVQSMSSGINLRLRKTEFTKCLREKATK